MAKTATLSRKKKGTSANPFTIEHFEWWTQKLVLDSGKNFALEPFQKSFLEDVFRGYPECWLIVPEGNTKTTTLAALGLYGLRFSEDGLIPIAASSRDQVKIMYRQAKGFVRRSDLTELGFWFQCFDGYRRIDLRTDQGVDKRGEVMGSMEVFAADAGTGDGVIPYPFAFLDELHRQASLELYETWRGKLGKRQSQLIGISTAGEPGSEFEETRARVRAMGETTEQTETFIRVEHPAQVLHEWSVPEDGDVEDFELVARANPFSGITPETLAAKFAAPTMSMAHWRRFNCNIPTISGDKELFIPVSDWDQLADGIGIADGSVVCLGADGSRTWDTTVIAWAATEGDKVLVDARVFSVRPDQPSHVLHAGGKIDFSDVEEFIIDRFDKFNPMEAAYDPRYLERSMEIVDERLGAEKTVAVEPQSKYMRVALQVFYRLVAEGKLRHTGDPVLRAHIENTRVERDERSQEIRRIGKLDKRKAIDAVPAMAMAVWRMQDAEGSVYGDRELVMV